MKHFVKRLLGYLGLLDYVTYLIDGQLRNFQLTHYKRFWHYRRYGTPDGQPLPPMRLIWLVVGQTSPDIFLHSAETQVTQVMLPLLERNGFSIRSFQSILDFGCGCGRIMRKWHDLPEVALWGSDYNPVLIDWCQKYLPFAQYMINQMEPPLPCTAEKFSFLYARSVFTHLPEALQFAWLSEVHRVLEQDGVFLFTVSGDFFRSILTPAEQQQYDSGGIVIRDAAFEGQNACAAFHPRAYVQAVWPQMGFELLDFIPGGTVPFANQDTWLARKRN